MEKSFNIYFIHSLLKKGNINKNNKNLTNVIRDSFYMAAENMEQNKCIVLLMDVDMEVIAAYDTEYNKIPENIVNQKIEIKINENFKTGKLKENLFQEGEEKTGYIYLSKTSKLNGTEYILCTLTGFEDDLQCNKALESINNLMEKSINLVNKYSNYNDALIRALDSVDEGISFCDKDGYLRYINSSGCKINGVNKDEVLNLKADLLCTNEPMLYKVLNSKKSIIDMEYFLIFKEKTMHLINSGYVVRDDNGEITGAIDIWRGINRSKKLANTLAGYKATFTFEDIKGESRIVKDSINLAKVFSKSDETVLIVGESGTGKELFAQAIHNFSYRSSGPFIALNCANFPNDLIDSELFGYEEGSFTGAVKGGRLGKFELANGGTLFLDEIGEMQLHLQSKLLRVLETMCINRIGGNTQTRVNVRVIAATNRKLEELVEEGKFRKDLYYRLKVLFIEVPPLRNRNEDCLLLAEFFVNNLGTKINKNVKGISEKAKETIMKHTWPGNIRELENTLARSLYICTEEYITEENLLMGGLKAQNSLAISKKTTTIIDSKMALEALEITKGNKKKAAELLGVSRPTLYKLITQRVVKP